MARYADPMGSVGVGFGNILSRLNQRQYGYDPKLRKDTLSGLHSNAYTGGMSFANQASRALPARSGGLLNVFKQGAQLQGDIYRQGALPFAAQEAALGAQQRAGDVDLIKFLLAMKQRKDEFDASRPGVMDFLGNLLSAGATVGAGFAAK